MRPKSVFLISTLIIFSIVFSSASLLAKENKEQGFSVLFVIDCSGSMKDDNKIEDAKKAAIGAINSLSGIFEVGVIAFADCGGVNVVQGFSNSKGSAMSAVGSLSAGGATPLADALSYAKSYLMSSAKYESRSLIVLSDGQETCGGNPSDSFQDESGGGRDGEKPKDKKDDDKKDKEYPSGII